MTYDPNKVEDWVVSSSGFWRKGDVHANRYIVPFTGTWTEVKARYEEMMAMELRHGTERDALRIKQQEERRTLWEGKV